MAYKDYLPKKAVLGVPQYNNIVLNGEADRDFLKGVTSIKTKYMLTGETKEITSTSTSSDINVKYSSIKTYGNAGVEVNKGDYVVVENAIVYRYAGEETLKPWLSSYSNFHPSMIDENNNRINETIWAVIGNAPHLKPVSGASEDFIETVDGSNFSAFELSFTCDASEMISIFGISSSEAQIKVYEYDEVTLVEEIVLDMQHRKNIFLTFGHLAEAGNGTQFNIEITLKPHARTLKASLATAVITSIEYIGETLDGHTASRESRISDVYSDNVEKTRTDSSTDVCSGVVQFDAEDLRRVEYILSGATEDIYVFHIGAGEKFDQRGYIGKVSYKAPVYGNDKFGVSIDVRSLAYNVNNKLVHPDSTSGAPI